MSIFLHVSVCVLLCLSVRHVKLFMYLRRFYMLAIVVKFFVLSECVSVLFCVLYCILCMCCLYWRNK